MRVILSEKKLVVVLFIMVLITFSFAHEYSKKRMNIYINAGSSEVSSFKSSGQMAETTLLSAGKKAILPVAAHR